MSPSLRFKAVICILIASVILIPCLASALSSYESNFDYNHDNDLDLDDILIIADAVVKGSTETKYDVNNNGYVNLFDLLKSIRVYLEYRQVPKTCSDGTAKGECSGTKPLYCSSIRALVPDCYRCGCPEGQECISGGECTPLEGDHAYCRDSDGGKNYYEAGTVEFCSSDEIPCETYADTCSSYRMLKEYYCKMDPTLPGDTEYECPDGCENGRCN